MKRFGYEFLIFLLLVVLVVGIWIWKDRQADQAVVEQQERCDERVSALTAAGERWAADLAASEAEAAFRSFAAGVYPLVLGNREEALNQALGALLEVPGVAFVHVVNPDGAVIASSDRKLTTTGRVGADGRWALDTTELVVKEAPGSGVTELAAPIIGGAGPAGYLWMGYEVDDLLQATRPLGWEGSGAATVPEGTGSTDGGAGSAATGEPTDGEDGAGGAATGADDAGEAESV